MCEKDVMSIGVYVIKTGSIQCGSVTGTGRVVVATLAC